MENQTNPNPASKDFNKNLIIFAVGFLAVILFTSSYLLWQQTLLTTKLKSEIKSQEEKISQLLAESPEPTQVDDGNTTQNQDNRILLTPDNIKKYWTSETGCDEKFNYDNPSTLVTYTSKSRGLSVDLPYNPNWGNEKYRIEPFYEKGDLLKFGSIEPLEACYWERTDSILFKPAKTAVQTQTELTENPTMNASVEKITLKNGLTAFRYIDEGLSRISVIEVIGKKHNYKISVWPQPQNDGTEFARLEEIANSIKLLD